MAESVAYAGTPFDDYLRETGAEEDVLQDSDGPLDDEIRPESRASVLGDDAHPRPAVAAAARDPFADLLKYSLAMSSLLNARLSDALPLYAAAASADPPIAGLDARATTGARREGHNEPVRIHKRRPLEWGPEWDLRGHTWLDRSPAGNACELARWLVLAFVAIAAFVASQREKKARVTPRDATPVDPTASTSAVHAGALGSVDEFVSASQQLDLRVSRALGGIREVECIGWGLGLSHPLPPISRIEASSLLASPVVAHTLRTRVPSPLGFAATSPDFDSTPHFPSSSHPRPVSQQSHTSAPPLRAKALRTALASALSSTTDALNNARFSLKRIQGDLASATPAEIELERHELEAARDRAEAEERERRARDWEDGALSDDDDSTFGGVDRGIALVASLSSSGRTRQDPSPPSSKRSSVSLQSNVGSPRRRPVSLSLWQQASGAHATHYAALRDHDGDFPPPTPEQRTSARFVAPGTDIADDHDALGLVELQAALENLHSVRRGLLWRLLSMADRKLDDDRWVEAQGALDELTRSLKATSAVVAQAVHAEFGASGLGTESLDVTSRAAKRASMLFVDPPALALGAATPRRGHLRSQSATTHRARPTSWNAPAGGRPLSLTIPSNFNAAFAPPPQTSFAPSSRQPSARPSSTFPTDFAPPNPFSTLGPAAALSTFDAGAQEMALALRTIAAKLHVVTEDAKRRNSTSSSDARATVEIERMLSTHDSIRGDIDALAREWDNSRLALRQLVKPEPAPASLSRSNSYQGSDGVSGGNVSLDSIPDEDDDDDGASGWSSEVRTPECGPPHQVVREGTAAYDDAQRESYLPTPGDEQVFEAVAGRRESKREVSKLSRDERIQVMKDSRRASRAGSGSGSSAGGSTMKSQAGMVAELKDVLVLLKGRRHLPVDV